MGSYICCATLRRIFHAYCLLLFARRRSEKQQHFRASALMVHVSCIWECYTQELPRPCSDVLDEARNSPAVKDIG